QWVAGVLLELHFDWLPVRGGGFKILPLLKSEHPCQDVCWERLHGGIQVPHGPVVTAARILNAFLGLRERILQLGELLRSFQLRIILRDGEQTLQSAAKLVLSNGLITRRGGLHRLRTEFGNVLERALLVR